MLPFAPQGHRSYPGDLVPKGTVKWFNATKGYGFIQPQGGGGKDVFVRISAVEEAGLTTLNEGQVIEYEVVANKGKRRHRISRFNADQGGNSRS